VKSSTNSISKRSNKKYKTEEERISAKNATQRRYRERNKHKERAYYLKTRDSRLARERQRRTDDPSLSRKYNLKKMYGITLDQFAAMLAEQGSVCAICKADTPRGKGAWHVDHCHSTGRVRGLLCHDCNTGIGKLKDSPQLLRDAISYLEKHNGNEVTHPQ
jgi:Recombination endonuclease VII